jgi:hypothetical protein
MAEIDIRFDIGLGRRGTRALALLLVAGIAGEVASETVNLSTFYPSPAGVYQHIWSLGTGLTVLARDGGKVLVGTTTDPGTSDRLHVNGTIFVNGTVQADTIVAPAVTWNAAVNSFSADQGGSLELGGSAAGDTPFIDLHYGQSPTPASENFNVRLINPLNNRLDFRTALSATVMTINGSALGIGVTAPRAPLEVGDEGVIISRQTSCYWVNYAGSCTASQYMTGISGRAPGKTLAASGTANLPRYDNGSSTGGIICCACPTTGACASLP